MSAGRRTRITLLLPALFLLPLTRAHAQDTTRDLSGTVTDRQHEPLKGAVVQLENEATNSVISYITGPDGHYVFKHLSGNDDYRVWATFRTIRSKTRELSHFDGKKTPTIPLTVTLD